MILTCPECATSYFVEDSKISADGRSVKCASCAHRWIARLEAPLELRHSDEEGAIAREAKPSEAPVVEVHQLPGEELPKVFRAKADTSRKVREAATQGIVWAGLAAGAVVLIAVGVVFRVDVVRAFPKAASAYAGVGLPVNSLGLVIEGVKAEPTLQDGHAALAISGIIRNTRNVAVTTPPLRIKLLSKDGKALTDKIARPADPMVPPGETRHFSIAILDPPSSAHDLEVAFAPELGSAATSAHSATARPHADADHPALRGATEELAPEHLPEPIDAKPLEAGSPDALPPHG